MLAARASSSCLGRGAAGALVASRCAANKRALSATGQARLLEQCELVRWKLGFGNCFSERCGRPAVTFWACVRRLVHCSLVQRHPPHDFFPCSGRVDARVLVCLRLVRAARARWGVEMINWLRGAALHRPKSNLILRELGTRGKGVSSRVSSPGGVTPERSVLLGVARAGSHATSMPERAGDDRKAQRAPARRRTRNRNCASRRCLTSDRSSARSRAWHDGVGVFARWCLA